MADSTFPSDWHRDQYLADLEREVAGYRNRLSELAALGVPKDSPAVADAKSGEAAALAELERVGGKSQKTAEKRPRGQHRTTRG